MGVSVAGGSLPRPACDQSGPVDVAPEQYGLHLFFLTATLLGVQRWQLTPFPAHRVQCGLARGARVCDCTIQLSFERRQIVGKNSQKLALACSIVRGLLILSLRLPPAGTFKRWRVTASGTSALWRAQCDSCCASRVRAAARSSVEVSIMLIKRRRAKMGPDRQARRLALCLLALTFFRHSALRAARSRRSVSAWDVPPGHRCLQCGQ